MSETLLAHDHEELDGTLAELKSALAAEDAEKSFHLLDRFWARLAMHIRAENHELFPVLKRAAETSVTMGTNVPPADEVVRLLAELRHDHDFFMTELTAAMKRLREISRGEATGDLRDVRERIDAVSQRLETHNELEETQVYRWAAQLLPLAEQAALQTRIQGQLDRLPERFRGAGGA